MRRIVYFLVAAGLLACAAPAFSLAGPAVTINPSDIVLPSDPQAAMERARERVASGNLLGAITALQSYVETHPGEVGPERLLGDLYYRKGELGRAEATYRHILSYLPGDKETHNRLGSVYATENRVDDAIAEFKRSLPGTDSVPDLVRLYIRKGQLDKYKRDLENTAAKYPNDSEAQSEIGEVYLTISLPGIAVQYFKRALDDDPSSQVALNNLGLAYMDQDLFPQAIAAYRTCLSHYPYDYACLDNLGATYLKMGQNDQAETILRQAHKLAPERAEALINLGYLTDSRGDWKKAITFYVDAVTVYPYSPEAYIDLGYTYNQHGLYQLAQAALVKGLAIAPEDGKLHFLLGDTYSHLGSAALAADQYRDAAAALNVDAGLKRAAQDRVAALEHTPRPKATP